MWEGLRRTPPKAIWVLVVNGGKICKLCLVYNAESSSLLHRTEYYCTLPLQEIYITSTVQQRTLYILYNIKRRRSTPRLCFTRHHFAIAPQNWTKLCSATTGYHGSAPCRHIIMRYITPANYADANPNTSEPDHTLPVHGLAVSQSTKP